MKNFDKKFLFIIIPLLIIFCILIYFFTNHQNENVILTNDLYITNDNTSNLIENTIFIHIDGEITNPGIVELQDGSRISDAISAAGGITDLADISKINLAYKLIDGQKIRIPSIYDIEETIYVQNDAGDNIILSDNSNNLVNINSACQAELETLPGIGTSTACKIIDYRNKNGKFKKIEDIMNVSGIGEAKFNNIKDYICI